MFRNIESSIFFVFRYMERSIFYISIHRKFDVCRFHIISKVAVRCSARDGTLDGQASFSGVSHFWASGKQRKTRQDKMYSYLCLRIYQVRSSDGYRTRVGLYMYIYVYISYDTISTSEKCNRLKYLNHGSLITIVKYMTMVFDRSSIRSILR